MALLQSGKIFYINCGLKDYINEHGSSYTMQQYYNWFIQQFADALNITDSEYNRNIYINTFTFFLLPYINKSTNEKLALRYDDTGLEIVKALDSSSFEKTEWKVDNYFMCQTEDGVESGYLNKKLFNASKYLVFVVDTSFLDSHGFYTIGAASSENKILKSYVAPNIFVCDTINKFNNEQVDGLFCLNQFGKNYYPNFPNDSSNVYPENFSSPSIGVLIENYGGGTGLYPQVFTVDENSFSIVKLHFGKLRPAKDIYLTKTTTSVLSDFCYYQNMVDEKNSWKEIIREDEFGNKRNFLLGLNSISNSNIDLKSKNNWIPIVEAIKEPLALKFCSDGEFTLSVKAPKWNGILEYSKDKGKTWIVWHGEKIFGNAKNSIYLRGSNNTRMSVSYDSASDSVDQYLNFTGKTVKGNIETLLDYKIVQKGNHPPMDNFCFLRTFYHCTSLIEAPDFPATQLSVCCYGDLFNGCTSLREAPKLPATELEQECYRATFSGCTSLIKAPELPATILKNGCYEDMFNTCTSLKEPPKLLATTLAQSCYRSMFWNCTSLKKLPKLSATLIPAYAYYTMFAYCSQIKVSTSSYGQYKYSYRIPTSGTGSSVSQSYTYIFYGTGGSFTGTPTLNKIYYTTEEPV